MADFSTPFAQDGERRNPTETEAENGFPCGPANRSLFGGLFYRLESELQSVIAYGGIAPEADTHDRLKLAILAMIAEAVGVDTSGDTSGFLLTAQARARLPIFPWVDETNNHCAVVSPGTGQVRVPAAKTIWHRGIYSFETIQTDFATDPSKTYHLRCDLTTGTFTLNDVANLTYNPTSALETNAGFDSTFDDMLVARVITSSGNVPTIVNLANKPNLKSQQAASGAGVSTSADNMEYEASFALNWARTPLVILQGSLSFLAGAGSIITGQNVINQIATSVQTRYGVTAKVQADFDKVASSVNGKLNILAIDNG